MNIRYNFKENFYNYSQNNPREIDKLSFLLTNIKGDFLNLGFYKNSLKNQGYNYLDLDSNKFYKFIDMIIPNSLEVKEVIYEGFKVKRKFRSKLIENLTEELDSNSFIINNNENNKNNVETNKIEVFDSFYLSPTGGLIYEIENYEGNISLKVDFREMNDFSTIGRYYNSYKKDGILFLEYTKKDSRDESKTNYKLIMGIKTVNFDYSIIGEWEEMIYSYSKNRSSKYSLYIYDYLRINVDCIGSNKRILFGFGFTEEEVKSQIELIEKYQNDLENMDKNLYDDLTKIKTFSNPISEDLLNSYRISNNAIYRFLRQDRIEKKPLGLVAGFPWFAQIWARDELIALRAFINNGEYSLVKERFFDYLNKINNCGGLLPRLNIDGSLYSADGVFWLSKRIMDLIHKLDSESKLFEVLSIDDLKYIYNTFLESFYKIIEKYWDVKKELLKANDGDPWMDTIHVEYPLDMQVLLMEFVSNLAFIGKIIGEEDLDRFLNLENLLREKIRSEYYNGYYLYQEPNSKLITSNIFLAYYIYPDLFLKKEWELIFENSLKVLENKKGLISTISRFDPNFKGEYSGENNESYHNGDSWYWINNIAAIAMFDLNEFKFKPYISKILVNSSNDILKMGCIGFGSELSSANRVFAEGSLAQLWSSSTFIEMIDFIFRKYGRDE